MMLLADLTAYVKQYLAKAYQATAMAWSVCTTNGGIDPKKVTVLILQLC